MATSQALSFWIVRSGRRLILNTHFDLIIFCLWGRGTRFQVCIPRRDANLLLAAFIHLALFGDFRSCHHVFGVSMSLGALALRAQVP